MPPRFAMVPLPSDSTWHVGVTATDLS